MKVEKTYWNPDEYQTSLTAEAHIDLQPGFGVEIAWNTRNIFKPYLVITFWKVLIQIGWLVD